MHTRRIGDFGSPGVSLLVEGGRIVAKGNTFQDACGVEVEPRIFKDTTVRLERNTFEGEEW